MARDRGSCIGMASIVLLGNDSIVVVFMPLHL